ncbi:TPA: type I-E CRISPR-associated protein Cas6/Cse3/CasE [Klebsiella pneumoniae]
MPPSTMLPVHNKEKSREGRGRRQFAPSEEASYQLALTKLAKAGFKPGQIVVSGPKFVHIDKGNAGRGFTLPVFTVQGTAIISNQQEAEVGIVYGVGPKRVFGCGFMHLAGQ